MTSSKLRVVLTNDDGPPGKESPYIFGLYRHLTEDLGFDVKVVIPSSQKSWIGKAFQIKDIVAGRYYYPRDPDGKGEVSESSRPLREGELAEWIVLDATPASCANIAVHNLYADKVDLLLSGPNFGRNSSAALLLSSGTVGAALSSSLSKIRSIALSYGTMIQPTPTSLHEPAHKLSGRIITYLWDNWSQEDVLYSINIPMIHGLLEEEGLKIYWTSVWRNSYGRLFKAVPGTRISSPRGGTFKGTDAEPVTEEVGPIEDSRLVFRFSPDLHGIIHTRDAPPGSDGWALAEGAVSVTPLQARFAETSDNELRTLHDRMWKMKL